MVVVERFKWEDDGLMNLRVEAAAVGQRNKNRGCAILTVNLPLGFRIENRRLIKAGGRFSADEEVEAVGYAKMGFPHSSA